MTDLEVLLAASPDQPAYVDHLKCFCLGPDPSGTALMLLLPMMFNDRLAVGQASLPWYDRFWCYPKGGELQMAAKRWLASGGEEPDGWIKSYDGRYHSAPREQAPT